MTINNNYEIIKTIFENDFQRILECRDKTTDKVFINNIIFNSSLIQLIDEEKIKNIFSSVIGTYKSDDRLYIFSEPCDYETLSHYIKNNDLTLKKQFDITEQVIDLGTKIFNMTDILQYAIMKYDNLCLCDGELCTNNIIIFDQPYDINENITIKRIGDIIHYIFSRETIKDYDVSDELPPDILKIVVKCLTNEYDTPGEALKDLHKSQIYTLINPEINTKGIGITKINKTKDDQRSILQTNIEEKLNEEKEKQEKQKEQEECEEDIDVEQVEYEDDDNIADEDNKENEDENCDDDLENFLNDDNIIEEKSKYRLNKTAIILISLVIIIPLLFIGYKRIKNAPETNTDPVDPIESTTKSAIEEIENTTESGIENKDNVNKRPETIEDFFSEELVKKTGYNGNTAEVSFDVCYDGYSSLLAENKTKDKSKILFAVVDLENEKYSYLKNRQIGISVRLKALKDVKGTLIVEAFNNGKISANACENDVEIYDDVWTMKQIVMNVGYTDRIDVYLEYEGVNKVWIDSIELDILK